MAIIALQRGVLHKAELQSSVHPEDVALPSPVSLTAG